jgi:Na+/H+-dicarboxylate symporter
MPLTFPAIKAGFFFSASLVEIAEVDFIDLYIPVNPFSSLARTVVPVAAVFSVAFGVALIGVENKRSLREILTAISKTLTRIAMMVVKITPIGVFAIAPMLRAP